MPAPPDTIGAMARRLSARSKWITGVVLGLVLALVGTTAGYAAHFAERALPGVSVAGTSVTGQTQQEVAEAVAARFGDLTVTVNVGGEPTSASLSDLGVSVDAEATAARAFASNSSVVDRVTALFRPQDVGVAFSSDEAALLAFGADLSEKAGTPVQDAAVDLADDGTSFQVTPAVAGVGIDTSQLTGVVSRAASSLSSQAVDLEATEVQPAITTEAAQKVADAANAMVALDVTLTDGIQDYSPSATEKASWVHIPAGDGSLGEPEFDADAVTAWVEETATATNEEPVSGVHNVNSRGDVVSVASAGEPGWTVSNAAAVAQGVLDSLTSGQSYSGDFDYDKVEPEFETQEIADGAEDLAYQAAPGEKWIDINLSNYTTTAYEGATVVRGPVYMVPGAPGTETVTGTYHVYLKYEKQTMRGTNLDGSKYVTPDVPWVTYFYEGYGLHGAPWRSSFGWGGPGGSHGCVNMPVEEAKWFFDWSEMGTTVVSHY